MTAGHLAPGDVVRRWVAETWNEEEPDARRRALHELHPATFQNEGEAATPDFMVEWHDRMRATFPDLHYEIDELVEAGGRVVMRWTAHGTHRGTLWGLLPATGRTASWRGLHLLTVHEGQISEVWAAAEWVEVLQQLGAQLLPAEDARRPVPRPPLAVIRPFTTRVVNPFTRTFVAWLPWFGVLHYRGRKTGKAYRIPMNVFAQGDRYVFALTYGSGVQWVKNVMASGEAELEKRGRRVPLSQPRLFVDKRQSRVPMAIRLILRAMRVQEFLEMTRSFEPRSDQAGREPSSVSR